jgi:HPt (histidine-containing phosphotransfer) domain-containing protein
MNDYLSKPVKEAELEAMLAKWMPEGKHTAREEGAAGVRVPPAPKAVSPALDAGILNGLRQVAKDKFGTIVRMFLANTEKLLGELDSAVAANDAKGAQRAAHSLKSSSGQLGAVRLQALMARIEAQMAEGGAAADVALLLEQAREEFARARKALEAALS